jgi:hypothetical protein
MIFSFSRICRSNLSGTSHQLEIEKFDAFPRSCTLTFHLARETGINVSLGSSGRLATESPTHSKTSFLLDDAFTVGCL